MSEHFDDDDLLPEHPSSKQYFRDCILSDPKTGHFTGFDYLEQMYASSLQRGRQGFLMFKEYREIVLTEASFDFVRKYDERFLKYLDPDTRRRFLAAQSADGLADYRFAKRAKAQKTWWGRIMHHPIMYKK
jgi:hypothetical protein